MNLNNMPTPSKVVNHARAIEGVLNRDIFLGAAGVDFFHTEASMYKDGVGRYVSQGTLCYQAGTPVELASEVHFSDGNKLGYFRIGGRPPMLLCDFKAFQAVSMNDLLLQAEAAGQLGPAELQHLATMRANGLMPPPLAVDAPTPLVDHLELPGDVRAGKDLGEPWVDIESEVDFT